VCLSVLLISDRMSCDKRSNVTRTKALLFPQFSGFVQVWDYQARTCVQTLGEHTHNVSCVAFHPDLPIIITGAEDGLYFLRSNLSL
jgi:WD40 repeat protein